MSKESIIKVTVGPTKNSPQYEKGKEFCYYINDHEAPKLIFNRTTKKGKPTRYCFEINTPGYPFVLEADEPADPASGRLAVKRQLNKPLEKGRFIFTVDSACPDQFSYGCSTESYMGGPIILDGTDNLRVTPIDLPKPLSEGTCLRVTKEAIFIGLVSGQIYRYAKNNLEIYCDLITLTKSSILKLYDFVLLPDRFYALVTGVQKKPQFALIEINLETNEASLLFRIAETQPANSCKPFAHIILSYPTLFITADKNIYRVDVQTAKNWEVYDDNEDDTLYRKSKESVGAMILVNNLPLYFGKEAWIEINSVVSGETRHVDKRLTKLGSFFTTADQIEGKEIFAGNSERYLICFSLEGDRIASGSGWTTEQIPPGLISIVCFGERVYLLFNTSEKRVLLGQLEKWRT